MTDVGATATGTAEETEATKAATNQHRELVLAESDTDASAAVALTSLHAAQNTNTMASETAGTTSATTSIAGPASSTAPQPRPSPWKTTCTTSDNTSPATQTTSLATIMAEQQTDQNRLQIEVAQQAQEDELLRQALEQSRITAQQEAHERDQRQHQHLRHGAAQSANSASVTTASSCLSATHQLQYAKQHCEDGVQLTEQEMEQIRQALEESDSQLDLPTQCNDDGTSNTKLSKSTPVIKGELSVRDTEPSLVRDAAKGTSTGATTYQDSNNVNWQAAAEFLSPVELQQIQQALAASSESAALDDFPSCQDDEETARNEQASYQLALELARQEFAPEATVTRGQRQPEGHVRVVPRAQILQQRAGAFHATGPVDFVHPADLTATASSSGTSPTAGGSGRNIPDDDVVQGTTTGFRMNAAMPQEWNRRARNGHTIVGPDAQIRTKHDTTLDAQANAHRLALEMDTAVVGNRAFNAFHQSMKRSRLKGVATSGTGRAGSDADGVKGGAMDGRVREQVSKIVNQGWISKLNGAVKEGKEALVYHGEQGEGSGGFDVAVKVFKRIQEFRGRGNYVDGDLRYAKTPFGKIGQREQLEMWTEKEFRNLVRANRSGVPVATPLYYKDNILLMRFLGEDGWPCPQLREIDLRKGSSRWTTLYRQVMQSIKLLYQQAHLVHGDLSEYNILAVPAWLVHNKLVADVQELQAVLIDFGQAVEFRHPDAEALLRRDLDRINTFFVRQGVASVMPADEAYLFCTLVHEAL